MDWNEVFKKYGYLLLAGLIVLVAIALFAFRDNDQAEEQNQGEQTAGQNSENSQNEGQNQNQNSSSDTTTSQGQGNVSVVGTLLDSDNAGKGNYVLDSERGRIYVFTKRDFSDLVGKRVTMDADGSLNDFAFLGFREGTLSSGPGEQPEMGGAPEEDSFVRVVGNLQNSDNLSRGNYVINSNQGRIYLQSARNYSAWIGEQVELTATGTINSFTGAILNKI